MNAMKQVIVTSVVLAALLYQGVVAASSFVENQAVEQVESNRLWLYGGESDNELLAPSKVSDIADNAKKVPVPAAALLFGPALVAVLGLAGFRRRDK